MPKFKEVSMRAHLLLCDNVSTTRFRQMRFVLYGTLKGGGSPRGEVTQDSEILPTVEANMTFLQPPTTERRTTSINHPTSMFRLLRVGCRIPQGFPRCPRRLRFPSPLDPYCQESANQCVLPCGVPQEKTKNTFLSVLSI